MPLILDNIIFSLQRSGGISLYWSELIKALLCDGIPFTCLEHSSAQTNVFRKEVHLSYHNLIKERFNPKFFRGNVHELTTDAGVFHSSYYRIPKKNYKAHKVVTTVHDFTKELHSNTIETRIFSHLKGKAINRAETIICVSNNTKNDLLRLYPHIDKKSVVVIPNGVSKLFHQVHEKEAHFQRSIRAPFLPGDYLLYVGDRKPAYKQFSHAVALSAHVKRPLLIVGGTSITRLEYRQLIHHVGVGNFHHLGYLPTSELNLVYNNAFALVYPSRYEGFGLPLVEAQRAGCPILAYAHSSIPEVTGNSPFLAQDGSFDALAERALELERSATLRDEQIEAGLAHAQAYSWETAIRAHRTVYEALEGQRQR